MALIALFGNHVQLAQRWKRDFVFFDNVAMFVYLGSLLFWMVAFWLPVRKRMLSVETQNYFLALRQRGQHDLDRMKSIGGSPL
jgi:hypothetical protein